MDKKLYGMMNWPEIEGVVYSECDRPHELLGGHLCENGYLVQVFKPHAVSVHLKTTDKNKIYEMEKVDEAGYFAFLLPSKKALKYTLITEDIYGKKIETADPYSFKSLINEADIKSFNAGSNYYAHKMLGAHVMSVDGITGTNFAVWAPNAIRVSVVGDFNNWDGREYQMRRLGATGIFDIFIPGVNTNDIYKFEIKCKGGLVMLKSDPYAYCSEVRPNTASIVYDIEKFKWNDSEWMSRRDKSNVMNKPMSVYEIQLGAFKKSNEKRKYPNYRELAPQIIDYVKDMGYTHVELTPLNEYSSDHSLGYHTIGYYSPTSRFGKPEDFMWLVDQLHQAGIGVIIDWVVARFSKDLSGLSAFDGTFLYECADPKENSHPDTRTLLFNYARNEVSSFLIGSALFLAEYYHVDGIKVDEFAPMLYRDYGKAPGEWIANIYGEKENIEAAELLKNINSQINKLKNPPLMIAQESSAWPMVTGKANDNCLGFDYKWNNAFAQEFFDFMMLDPIYRKARYSEMTYGMMYAYSEKFILGISHNEIFNGNRSMISRMAGSTLKSQYSNLRVAYGYIFTHPGRKLMFMGQDFGQQEPFSESEGVQWRYLYSDENYQKMQEYVRDLNSLYLNEPALYELDDVTDGFKWVVSDAVDETIIAFSRKACDGSELLVIVNFTPVTRVKYKVGVDRRGKYKEIFNSDALKYGGDGKVNSRIKNSKAEEWNGKTDSITVTVPPLGISVFRFSEFTQEEENKLIKESVSKPDPKSMKKDSSHKAIKKTGGGKSDSKVEVKSKIKIPQN